ncbi:sulfatase [Paludisphaera sp.]|uniref:sulfatase n=1 Tax=Paludisphaera sp. TaxID=2017432 RepID=UPI00301D9FE6
MDGASAAKVGGVIEAEARRAASPLGVARLALLFGLLTGTLELTQWLVRNEISGGGALGTFQMSRHFFWMIPASNVAIFGAIGVVLGLFAWVRPAWARKATLAAMGFLCGLALLLTIPGLYGSAAVALAAGLGATTARRALADPVRFRRALVVAPAALGVVAAVLYGWGRVHATLSARVPATAATGRSPNVLLLVLDTVRAESLSLYGYHRDTTPNLNRLAARAVRFDQARSTAPWTLPSHASMFTGRWPHELNVGEKKPLDGTYPTLAEALSSRGYATGGFIANTFFCNQWFGLGRGFRHYDDFYEEQESVSVAEALRCSSLGRLAVKALPDSLGGVERRRKDAARINGAFLNWLDGEGGGDRPFFAFLNYFDAHGPFIPPDGFERPFGRPAADAEEEAMIREWDVRSRAGVTDAHLALARDSYDDCLAYLDQQVGRLFDELERRGILDETLVIVTSDHGEGLGEHDLIGHGRSLYDQETRVPLLIFLPRGERGGESVAEAVSIRDIPATVLDVLGLDGPAFPGASLARRPTAEAPVLTEVRIKDAVSKNPARPPAWRGPMAAVIADGFSYIRNADGREELYDVLADPAQLRDLAPEPDSAETLTRLRESLDGMRTDGGKD